MNVRLLVLLFLLSSVVWSVKASDGSELEGIIKDVKTGEPIAFATVYFPDLKTGTTTDLKGHYKIEHLPATQVLVQVSYLGYRSIVETLDLSVIRTKNFSMEYVATEMNEVVITGLSKATEQKRTPTPITVIPSAMLAQESYTNIVDAIASRPGISQISTGPGISKPVIRGLGYNRVVVVADGIRQEGQQWGDEHGIEIDGESVEKVEILKGPASLAYGSDALAGVVNFIQASGPEEGQIMGRISSNYQSNNGLISASADLAGNVKGLIWNIRYSNKLAHAYQNKYDGFVYNSGFREQAGEGMIGLNRSWGYSHLLVSAYHLKPGIIEGERDSATGRFTMPVVTGNDLVEEPAGNTDFKSYSPGIPYQDIGHFKVVWSSRLISGSGHLKTIFGFQQNQRKEYGDVFNPDQYGLYFLLNTFNYDIRYSLSEFNDLSISFGVNGMGQTSENKGSEFLVPAYHLFDFGIFTVVKKNLGKIDLSGGLRFDNRNQTGRALYLDEEGNPTGSDTQGSIMKFSPFTSDFKGISGSIGATWQISQAFYSKLNFSRGYRSPNIAELGAHGEHEGTQRFEIGDPNLKAENSLQTDYALGLESEHISAEMDLFANTIRNYIYARKLNAVAGGDSISADLPSYKFVSGHAVLSGGELRIEIHPHPLDWINLENTFSFVNAVQPGKPDSLKYLPLIPPPRYQVELKVTSKQGWHGIKNSYLLAGASYYFRQNRYYEAYGTETSTPSYLIFRLGAGLDIVKNGRKAFSVNVMAENLTDVAYQSHLSRLKYTGYNFVTNRQGVFNMGRNFSVKVLVPLEFKVPSARR